MTLLRGIQDVMKAIRNLTAENSAVKNMFAESTYVNKVKVKNDRQLVSARELYKGLELKIRFSLWVSKNFEGFEEGQDFTSVTTVTEVINC